MAYWPPLKADPATATVWIALDASTRANGCMRFVPGTHTGPLRKHRPVLLNESGGGRLDEESSHALMTDVDEEAEAIRYAEIARGDGTWPRRSARTHPLSSVRACVCVCVLLLRADGVQQ